VKVNPKTTAILLGGVIGAALGAAAAWTYMRQQETRLPAAALGTRQPLQMEAGAGDFIKIGVALLALIRQFDDLFKPKK
jgi:hypothetical protein